MRGDIVTTLGWVIGVLVAWALVVICHGYLALPGELTFIIVVTASMLWGGKSFR